MAHMVFCTKYKAEMEGLDEPPFDSDFGQKIYKNVSKKAWGEWVERQKMLLNEYRLQPWTREAQEFLVEQMNEFSSEKAERFPRSTSLPPSNSARVHLTEQPRCRLPGRQAKSRDVAQPGRAHLWGG